MIRWICNVRAKDEVSSDSLLTKLGIQDLDVVLRTSRMRWFGHVERSTGWIAEVCKLNVVAQKRSGRPRKSWDEVLENEQKEARYGFYWPSKLFWVERTPSRKTCQKAQPSVEENRALKWIWWWWWWFWAFSPFCREQMHSIIDREKNWCGGWRYKTCSIVEFYLLPLWYLSEACFSPIIRLWIILMQLISYTGSSRFVFVLFSSQKYM